MEHHRSPHLVRSVVAALTASACALVAVACNNPQTQGAPGSRPVVEDDHTFYKQMGLEELASWSAVVRATVAGTNGDTFAAGGPASGRQRLCDATVIESITGDMAIGEQISVTCSASGTEDGLTDAAATRAYGLPLEPPAAGSERVYALTPLPGPGPRWASRELQLSPAAALRSGDGASVVAPDRTISVADGGRIDSMGLNEFQSLSATIRSPGAS